MPLTRDGQRAQVEQAGSLAHLRTTSTTGPAGAPGTNRASAWRTIRTGREMRALKVRVNVVAITARMMAIAPLAASSARAAKPELRAALDGPAARAGFEARAGARGAARHGAAGERSGDSQRTCRGEPLGGRSGGYPPSPRYFVLMGRALTDARFSGRGILLVGQLLGGGPDSCLRSNPCQWGRGRAGLAGFCALSSVARPSLPVHWPRHISVFTLGGCRLVVEFCRLTLKTCPLRPVNWGV